MPKKKENMDEIIRVATEIKEKEASVAPDQKTVDELTKKITTTATEIARLRRKLGSLTSLPKQKKAPAEQEVEGKSPRANNIREQINVFFKTNPEGGTSEDVVEYLHLNKAKTNNVKVKPTTVQTNLNKMVTESQLKFDGKKYIPATTVA